MSGQQIDTLIVGSGFAGLGAAVRLDGAGRRDWLMLEKADTLGGTWRDNAYPGCACDVESHLYSFSFFPNDDWTRTFARQTEIRSYLEDVADHYRLRGRIRFGAHVTSAEWDGRGWDVRLADGSVLRARYVIFGTGALHEPAVPEIEGLDRFAGAAFHSARWPRGHDLRGRRVAVIGTGASAIQLVPAVAPVAGHLTLFQRTAPWVLPKPDKPIRERTRTAFRRVPGLRAAYRASLYWRHEAMVLGFMHPRVMKLAERVARLYLRRVFAGDPELRRTVTPDFTMGCKRVLMSNDYYPALRRDDVTVETAGIERITEHGVVTTDGVLHEVDTIVFGTGFRVGSAAGAGLGRMAITGRDGVKLSDVWRDGAQAFHGTTIAGFPNLFTVVGPNTGLGHSSMVLMIESQLNYVLDAMALVDRNRAVAIDTRADVQDEHNADLQRRLGAAVWGSGGCASWYLDGNGRNRTLWPGYTFTFRNRTRRVDPAAHELVA